MCAGFHCLISWYDFHCLISWYEYSRGGYETPSDDDSSEEEEGADDVRHRRFREVGDESIKKPVSVDAHGYPYGIMKTCLEDDVKLFAKDLDPTVSWESQPPNEKARFFKRLYAGMGSFFSRKNSMFKPICNSRTIP